MKLQIVEVTINTMDMKAQVHKCLEAIGLYCRTQIANKIPGQGINVQMLDENGQHPMFFVTGEGNVWYLPGDCDAALFFDHDKKDNVFDHWKETMSLIETWPELKQQLEQIVAASAADTNSIMHFQV